MIGSIANTLSNPALVNLTQNTAARVSIETGLKSVGRPGFILIDKDIPPETKKYAVTKEFLYQAICLAVYLAVIPPIFKSGSFKLGKKMFGNTHPEFAKFKNSKEYLDYHKLATKNLNERKTSISKMKDQDKFMHDGLKEQLLNNENPEKYSLIKGCIEAGTFIGSILGLAILAPEISHYTIHPLMKLLGLENKKDEKLDVKA